MLEWPSFIVLLTIILLIGSMADLLIINEEWSNIKSRLFIASLKIKNSSLNDLIFIIASRVVRLLESAVTSFPKKVKKPEIKYVGLSLFVFPIIFILTIYFFINWQYLFTLILIFPILSISFFWFLLILIHESVTEGRWNDKFDDYWRIYTKTALISAAVTFLAILIGAELFSYFNISEYWFNNIDHDNGVIKHAMYIGIINYPFDFFSLAITYWCIKRISKKQGAYYFYPILDVFCSLLLSSILYIIFLSISNAGFSPAVFVEDIISLYANGPDDTGYDLIYLTPVILSTFIPISFLAIIFFILIFYKTVSIFLSRFLHVLSEKEGSIFKDIAVTISALCALINAITLQ